MTTREDILTFLRDPGAFARLASNPSLWTDGLDRFAIPSITAHQDRPLRPAQEAAWRGLADKRVGLVLGPPGTGKTHLLSWLITGHGAVRSAAGQSARTFVTAFTKNAVGNVLDAVAKRQALHDPTAPQPIFYGSPPTSGLSGGVQLFDRGDEADVVQAIVFRKDRGWGDDLVDLSFDHLWRRPKHGRTDCGTFRPRLHRRSFPDGPRARTDGACWNGAILPGRCLGR